MSKQKKQNVDPEEIYKKLEEEIKKEEKEKIEKVEKLRDILERDFSETTLLIPIQISQDKRRMIPARVLTQDDYFKIISIVDKLMKIENKLGELTKKDEVEMKKLREELATIAAKYSVDKSLDKEFWLKIVPLQILITFLIGLTTAGQEFIAPAKDLATFR